MKYLLLSCIFIISWTAAARSVPKACRIKENIRMQIEAISANLANANTTRTVEGTPYQRKELICKGEHCVVIGRGDFVEKYDPQHPHADSGGYVRLPKINVNQEMNAIVEASHKYEAAQKDCLAENKL